MMNEVDAKKWANRLSRNTVAAVVQAIASTLIVMLLYRYLISHLGVNVMGSWSLVVSLIGIAKVTELGVSVSLTKLLAESYVSGAESKSRELIATAFWLVLVVGLIGVGIVSIGVWVYAALGIEVPAARALVVSTAMAVLLNVIGAPMRAGLDGAHRADIRQFINVGQQLLFLLFTVVFVPKWRIVGFAWAQALSSLIAIISVSLFAKYILRSRFSLIGYNKKIARRLLAIGLPTQGSVACQQFYEPLTKLMLMQFGGFALVSVFELATRIVVQLRSIIVSSMEPLIPYIASLSSDLLHGKVKQIAEYRNTMSLIGIISIAAYGSVLCVFPAISIFFLGKVDGTLIVYGCKCHCVGNVGIDTSTAVELCNSADSANGHINIAAKVQLHSISLTTHKTHTSVTHC